MFEHWDGSAPRRVEGMSEQELAKLREMLSEYGRAVSKESQTPDGIPVCLLIADDIVSQAVPALLAEVERLRAQAVILTREHCRSMDERDAARAENAALREIAQWLASFTDSGIRIGNAWDASAYANHQECLCCHESGDHAPDCLWLRARALLGETHEPEQKASEE